MLQKQLNLCHNTAHIIDSTCTAWRRDVNIIDSLSHYAVFILGPTQENQNMQLVVKKHELMLPFDCSLMTYKFKNSNVTVILGYVKIQKANEPYLKLDTK